MKKLNIRNVMKGAAALMAGALLFTACNTPEGGKSETREPAATREIWTAQQANDWYANQPWYVGSNFLPSTAINQLEMWQSETFDTATIDKELGMAQSIGMNIMRVYLHDLVFKNDEQGFYDRINKFLEIADRHRLLVTGGSDCHGMSKGQPLIGTVKLPYSHVRELKARIENRRAKAAAGRSAPGSRLSSLD